MLSAFELYPRWVPLISGLVLTFLLASTSSRFTKTHKKLGHYIQPSWPHAGPITHIHRLLWHNIHVIKIHGQKFTPPWSPWFESVKIFLFNMQLQMVTFFTSKFYCFRLHFIRGYSTSQWLRQIEDHWFHASLDFQHIWTVSAGILPGSCP